MNLVNVYTVELVIDLTDRYAVNVYGVFEGIVKYEIEKLYRGMTAYEIDKFA